MAVRDFKKFFRRRGKFVRQPHDDKRNFRKTNEDKKEKDDRRCFKCSYPNHFISDCPKHSFNDQKAFVVGCWSDSEDDFKKEEICLMDLDDNEDLCNDFSKIMHDEFEMSMMGELNYFLGLQIKQLDDEIFFNQSKYVKEMLKKFGLEDSKPIKTPMASETKLTRDGEPIDDTKYRGMIGSLLYLTVSRPNIMFSVCLCARFQEAPKTSHLEAVKRIFRYIKGTSHLGLWYPTGTRVETIVYADSDHAGDHVDRKSTSGVCTFIGCCLTSWFSKKQTALAISTTKSEYVSTRKACQQALWMKQALIDYDINLDDIPVLCDNKGVIDLRKNPVLHSRTKHIEIRHHFLRDNVQKGNISIKKVSFEDNIADILTKPLKREQYPLIYLD
nr:copia protein [Tanacetum cinerariifolium]